VARTTRRRSAGRRRARLDWVQNEQTYSPDENDINQGLPSAVVAPLVYSQQTRVEWWGTDTGFGPNQVSGGTFPNSPRQQVIRAVRGQIFVSPVEGWTTANSRFFGFRLTKLLQDPTTGDGVVPVTYNMQAAGLVVPGNEAAIWADKRFLWEKRFMSTFRSDVPTPIWVFNIHWSGRETLENDEGLFMYIENMPTPVAGGGTIRIVTFLRTLCEVPD